MTINDEILAIANTLANQGTKPTVALVKTKLTQTVPLPKIISVLKTWQHDPAFTHAKQEQKVPVSKPETDELDKKIQAAIAPLTAEIAELKALIKQLLNDTKN